MSSEQSIEKKSEKVIIWCLKVGQNILDSALLFGEKGGDKVTRDV